ncbi:flagellar basal body L-ring protein FlgH [Ideonella sp. DXS22W]|uniref:Flagellar L-ring protein n=1 Tax=Pseudaquabacterium inlustre TaxID=2984192 RepID=A0ABU9CDH9_9BURK
MSLRTALLALPLLLLLGGCEHLARLPDVEVIQPTAAVPLPAVPVAAPVPTGAIFRSDGYRPLFENHRARIVGDTLLVQIAEKVNATQSSTSNIDRKSALSASVTALPLLKSSALTRATATGSDTNTYEGKGTTVNTNDFSGTITATVVQVLPNGHLIVAAEKQIGVNANVDVLRFSGQVDPRAIAPGNTVQSTQIANVRVEQRGRGQQAEVQSMGWLGRFFLSVLPI